MKPHTIGLAALLAGCPKTQNTIETNVVPPDTSTFSLSVDRQLIAAYLIKNGELEEGVYWRKLNIHPNAMAPFAKEISIAYEPKGVKGSYADDNLILSTLMWKPSQCYYDLVSIDTGLDGDIDFGTTTNCETQSFVPFDALDSLEQLFLQRDYRRIVLALAYRIHETEDLKALQEVRPQ